MVDLLALMLCEVLLWDAGLWFDEFLGVEDVGWHTGIVGRC